MSACRYSRDHGDYLHDDGTPCRWDIDGQPTHHCTARRTCATHIAPRELTCARCLDRTRRDITAILTLAPLMDYAAIEAGLGNTEALSLAGPAADPITWGWRRRIAQAALLGAWRTGALTDHQLDMAWAGLEDDDDTNPANLLPRWAAMIAEDYHHDLRRIDLSAAASYLHRTLPRIAQDPEQDYPLLARELRRCRSHQALVLATIARAERGAPCPACIDAGHDSAPRLVKTYGHWCTAEDCELIHYTDDSGDRWVCPRVPGHEWTEKAYRERVADVYADATSGVA